MALLLAGGLLLSSLAVQAAPQAALTVTKTADTNDGVCDADCSLREALAAAGNNDLIIFAPALEGSTFSLSNGELAVERSLSIIGPGADRLSISGSNQTRVFYLAVGTTVTIADLSIQDGQDGSGDGGGGILVDGGNLTLTRVMIFANAALDAGFGGFGGGLYNAGGTVKIHQSLISGNSAIGTGLNPAAGGGIANTGIMTVTHTTITGNQTSDDGAGSYSGGIDNAGVLYLDYVTVAANSAADNGGGAFGGGISNLGGIVEIRNSIFAANDPDNCDLEGDPLTSLGYNLESGTDCEFTAANDLQNSNPGLGPLQNNGGRSLTLALQAGSPAIDRIPTGASGCRGGISTDQRGALRAGAAGGPNRGGTACDVGAFEFDSLVGPSAVTLQAFAARPQGGWGGLAAGLGWLALLGAWAWQRRRRLNTPADAGRPPAPRR
jgi:CSLREA domain-containing protein